MPGDGAALAPLADLETAAHTTGAQEIHAYLATYLAVPSRVLGADFMLSIPRTTRKDL